MRILCFLSISFSPFSTLGDASGVFCDVSGAAGRDGMLATAPQYSDPAGVTVGSCAPSGPNIIIIAQCLSKSHA